jgi:Flp pilus assembly protein TadB
MSRERARRRAVRLAEAEAARTARERARRRTERRRAALRRLRPRRPDRRRGRLFARRPPGQRAAIATAMLGVLGLTWLLVDSLSLRILITFLVVLTAPALVVLTFDRRI